jgi:hypothetical protein
MLGLRDLKLTRIDRPCDAFWNADASFGCISFVLYIWFGLMGVFRELDIFGAKGKRVE